MHLSTKRFPVIAGTILLLLLVSTAMYFHLQRTPRTPVHAAAVAAPVTVSANGTTYTCVPQPKITPPPTPKGVKPIPETYPALCPKGQVPQPAGSHAKIGKRLPGAAPENLVAAHAAAKPATPSCLSSFSAYFCYVSLQEPMSDIGIQSSMSQPNPYLNTTHDYHSLTEIAADNSSNDIVEVGNNVDQGLNGDLHTHLFISSWITGGSQQYNGGNGYVQYSSTLTPGMQVTASSLNTYSYELVYTGGNWWIYYNTGWVGYYPGSTWSGNFTSVTQGNYYGEVAAGESNPCTDMGNGQFGSNSTQTRPRMIASTYSNTHTFVDTPGDTESTWYDHSSATTGGTSESFYYGGPGYGGVVKGC